MDVRKTVLVGHSAERMFDLIEACEHYPDFLPWCSGATVVGFEGTNKPLVGRAGTRPGVTGACEVRRSARGVR